MVYRFKLTCDENIDILDLKNFPTTTIRYTLPNGLYENSDIISMLKSLFPSKVKVDITIDDIWLNSK